ncbi:branched-chain amino acid ABC transporter permease [Enemella sp. A6]|uniref:branched-chain amino acid ABC transporter permease n=1 Tax=Enemella sp. A6 TaxID=3440152 RepID=UPI003EBF6502
MTTETVEAAPTTDILPRVTWGSFGLLALGFVLLAAGPFVLDPYALDVATTGLAYGLMAMGLAVLVGQAGLPSLGHAAFLGVGGYTAGLVSIHINGNYFLGMAAGAVAGLLLSLLLGAISMRAQGIYFLMISLAAAELIHVVAIRFTDLTGGDNGLSGIPAAPVPVFESMGLPRVVSMYWFTLIVVGLAYVLLRLVLASPHGKSITGSHDNPDRMRAIGYSVTRIRIAALALSGVTTAIGGVLLTFKDTFIAPTALAPDASILLLVMVLVGGSRSLLGPLLTGIGLVALRAVSSSLIGDWWIFALGVLFVVTVFAMPSGIAGLLRGRPRTSPLLADEEER